MKYGETLRQRSVPAWSHYNIDYDDIKQFIKEQTSNGKAISVPSRDDETLQDFEKSLFVILADQHQRIDLFVRSKAGEIRRRLDHSRVKLKQLSARPASVADQRIPVGRLERFGRLENDILKAGDEIKCLARFTSTQRTAFRKLLKKYKKWTGSTQLEDRLREEVLDDPKSFTKLDLGPLLDGYSATLQQVRTLYENKIQQAPPGNTPRRTSLQGGSSTVSQLQASIESGSRVDFDVAIATVPLGESGTFASYLVHPENIVELQMVLLQHLTYYTSRSRSNSVATPIATSPPSAGNFNQLSCPTADYFALEAGNAERFAEEQNTLTVNDRERREGSKPQKIDMCARWNSDEEAVIAFVPATGSVRLAHTKREHVYSFFDREIDYQSKEAATCADAEESLTVLRQDLIKDASLRPLYEFTSCRSRFVGTSNSHLGLVMATLDTSITTEKVEACKATGKISKFPFAVLLVRQEGSGAGGLLTVLDHSYLVERIPGFSMEYHAIWETNRSSSKIPAPFWLPVLARDIRKLPPPALRRNASTANATPSSRDSVNGVTDCTTAVENTQSDSVTMPEGLNMPPARAFRKKRRRAYPQQSDQQDPQARYWSEYDHPEDGSEAGDAYVVYIDPNDKSTLDNLFSRLGSMFARRKPEDAEEALLTEQSSPEDDDVSSDDEALATPRGKSYGTLSTPRRVTSGTHTIKVATYQRCHAIPHLTAISYVASIVILVMAYILAMTGRRKSIYEVDFGVLFAIASSLLFAVVGFASLFRLQTVTQPAWLVGTLVLIADAVGSGGLLAWMFS
ncbi:hypothetical protein LTR08_003427 [Meristemomyces frigidus]|nr:hypothetical protein LTR08_003427 [Meristemomyces frigidus]